MNAKKVYVIIPNWNGKSRLATCLDSLKLQSMAAEVIVVDNGSQDGSVEFVQNNYPAVTLLVNKTNLGFAGGVNTGLRHIMESGDAYAALLNNDAAADKNWLKYLVEFLSENKEVGIVTSKILTDDGRRLDSTGDTYTTWGLPFPRGRDEVDKGQYNDQEAVFGASGGASLYRLSMLKKIGLFDEDFFAYYEDVDLSFRAQLAGWKVAYEPKAVVHHQIGSTSGKIKGFTTYHTLKNLPLLLWKNVPWRLMPKIWPRLILAYLLICGRALSRGQFGPFFKGTMMGTILLPKKLTERHRIQSSRKVSAQYIDSIITHDLPPNARNLRRLRSIWWRLTLRRVNE